MKSFVRLAAFAGLACAALPAAAQPIAASAAVRPLPLEASVLEEINFARQNPQAYAEHLRDYRRFFEGELLYLPGDDFGVVTHEGADAVDEAIEFLENQAPLPPLSLGEVLVLAARDHAEDRGRVGGTGHISRDGAGPGDRTQRYGGGAFVGETISYGFAHADAVVRGLIVDDGVPGRGHRKLLFDHKFKFAGVGCGDHARFRHICVVDLSGTTNGGSEMADKLRKSGARVFTYIAK